MSGLAAINHALCTAGLPNLYEYKHEYPMSTKAIDQWKVHLKNEPHHCQSADALSPEAMMTILESSRDDTTEVQQVTLAVVLMWTGMRAQDLHVIRSKDVSRQAPADGAPRRYRFYAMHTKNDKLGTGPAHNREWYVPCICLETLDDAHKGKWARDLKRNPHLPCANFCPYQIVVDYLSICDDPAGGLRQMEIRQDPTLPPLAFARARSTTGNRRFLKVPLGINMIREAIPACNKRLPDNLKIAKATGQTGRHTFTSALDVRSPSFHWGLSISRSPFEDICMHQRNRPWRQ